MTSQEVSSLEAKWIKLDAGALKATNGMFEDEEEVDFLGAETVLPTFGELLILRSKKSGEEADKDRGDWYGEERETKIFPGCLSKLHKRMSNEAILWTSLISNFCDPISSAEHSERT